jgi:polysaccharide biosynthesis protein PslH
MSMKVLFLTHRLPYAPNRGDRIRAYFLLREMSRFAEVSLFSLVHDDEEEQRAAEVPFATSVTTVRVPRVSNLIRGAMSLPTARPLTHALLDAPDAAEALVKVANARPPDVVVAYCSGMARFAMAPPLDDVPFVLDMVDVDSEKWRALSRTAAWPRSWIYAREARTLGAFEAVASRRARAVLVVSERERDALQALAPDGNIQVVPNGVDVDAFRPPGPPSSEPVIVFCGVMDYEPNVEGVLWFAREVWPGVRAAHPDSRFVVVGANPTAAVRALAGANGIEVTGRVDAVQPYLWRAAVAVAPLRTARGLQNKVLEALAAGLPVVATTAAADGLPVGADAGCIRADEPSAFASGVSALLGASAATRRETAARAAVDRLAWESVLGPVREILDAAGQPPPLGDLTKSGRAPAGRR